MNLNSMKNRLERHFEQNINAKPISITLVKKSSYKKWQNEQSINCQNWLNFINFKIKPNAFCILPEFDSSPPVSGVVAIINDTNTLLIEVVGILSNSLPPAIYKIGFFEEANVSDNDLGLAWGLGAYKFPFTDKDKNIVVPQLVSKIPVNLPEIWLGRELINQPANILSPKKLANVVKELKNRNSIIKLYEGDELEKHFPLTFAVAKSGRPGVVVELSNQAEIKSSKKMKVTIIGKGVTFDSGGINLKPSRAMAIMKKDMGGAAHAITSYIMLRNLNLSIDLKLIILCADNMINHDSIRPGDILTTKNGITVEISDTDAEGRLLLADALITASEDKPDLIIDFATLTGAARIALGTDIPNVFSNYDEFMTDLKIQSLLCSDPTWRMPLWENYQEENNSIVADISNSPKNGYGGAITAALFLKHFLPIQQKWVHFDVMAWSLKQRPLSPIGGEIQGVRAVVNTIKNLALKY